MSECDRLTSFSLFSLKRGVGERKSGRYGKFIPKKCECVCVDENFGVIVNEMLKRKITNYVADTPHMCFEFLEDSALRIFYRNLLNIFNSK